MADNDLKVWGKRLFEFWIIAEGWLAGLKLGKRWGAVSSVVGGIAGASVVAGALTVFFRKSQPVENVALPDREENHSPDQLQIRQIDSGNQGHFVRRLNQEAKDTILQR